MIKTAVTVLLDIATGRSRREKHWKNTRISWEDLLKRIETTHRTAETLAEYKAATKARQDEIKDVGGFVGGLLTGGRRKPEAVLHRSLLTLDLDKAPLGFWEDFVLLYDCAAAIYSTHKHSPEAPRYRLLIPLDREVNPTEYEAIGRRVAGDLGIEAFDHTGFQPYRLMYWPSTSKDGQYVYQVQTGEFLSADLILATYQDYTDASQWPVSQTVSARVLRDITKQGDPLTKRGLIGAFCRCYSIAEVIEQYLSDIYDRTDAEDRYTYLGGSTAGGLVVYEDKYAYSHHGTDPISGRLCNAFDLVRLHKFRQLDEDTSEGTAITKLPSYKAMMKLAGDDGAVRLQIGSEKLEAAKLEFGDGVYDETGEFTAEAFDKLKSRQPAGTVLTADLSTLGLPELPVIDPEDMEWMKGLELEARGGSEGYKSTINNVVLVLRSDPRLAGRIAFNQFKGAPVVLGALPWQEVNSDNPPGRLFNDADAAALRHYLETVYDISAPLKIKDALVTVWTENQFHPIRNYLGGLVWDGVPRLDTVLSDYFGAEDCDYTAAVGRKWFTAAVARVFRPGCKFDFALVLVGVEGIYKSTFFDTLFSPWFTDNFSFHMLGTTRAAEQIAGYWGIEIGELTGLKRAEIEGIKAFLARRRDAQRGAYKEYLQEMARQCVFAGTTNEDDFLRGSRGNRRFWVVLTQVGEVLKGIELLAGERGQLWAEAVSLFKAGEKLYLTGELEKTARAIQDQHTETDDRFEVIAAYLEKKLPVGWEDMIPYQRRNFLQGDDIATPGTITRQRVSIPEIWTECLGCQIKDMNSINTKPLHDIMRRMKGWEPYKSRTVFKFFGNQRGYRRIGADD